MHAAQRFRNRREMTATDHLRADPLRELRQPRERLGDRTAQRAQREPFGQGVDGVDAGERRERLLVHHAVGMHDLRDAVIDLQGAGDEALGADRQQFRDIIGLRAEVRQHDVAGVIAGIDQIGRSAIARRWRAMAVDRHFQRHHRARRRIADFRPRPAVDHLRGQMHEQIDQPRGLLAAKQVTQQLVLLRTDTGKARDQGKQGIEESRAHGANMAIPTRHARLRAVHPRVFSTRGADIGAKRRYITPARHVRAFGVGLD